MQALFRRALSASLTTPSACGDTAAPPRPEVPCPARPPASRCSASPGSPRSRPRPRRLHRRRDDEAEAARRSAGRRPTELRSPTRSPRSTSRGATRNADIWLVPLAGGEPRRLTSDNPKSDTRRASAPTAGASPSSRRATAASQVCVLELAGGEPRKLTVARRRKPAAFVWLDDGTTLLVTADVYPECGADDACNSEEAGGRRQALERARLRRAALPPLGHLGRRPAQPPASWSARRRAARATSRPATRDVPAFSLGGPDDYARLARRAARSASRATTTRRPAASTNAELFVVPAAGGPAAQDRRHAPATTARRATAPTARRIAFRAQMRAGYESDRWRLMVYDRKSGRRAQPDRGLRPPRRTPSPGRPTRKTLYFTAEDDGAARRSSPCRPRAGAVRERGRRAGLRRPAGRRRRAHAGRDPGDAHPSRRRSAASDVGRQRPRAR